MSPSFTSFAARRAALQALGTDITPEMVSGTIAITAPDIDPAIYEGVAVARDLAYGEHELQVLDVYSAVEPGAGRPVLVYVHGGGFTGGAKDSPPTPYFRNLGAWAVQQGWVAVVIDYRLAPEFGHPSGAQDVAAAITWTVDRIAEHGGDPTRIFLSGQSAGAAHVADYVVGHGGYGRHGRALAGAILSSCIYDVERVARLGRYLDYWGEDPAAWAGCSTLQGLIDTDLPLLLTIGELDEAEFQRQAAGLVAEWTAQRGSYPPMQLLIGQNHLTPVYGIGSRWDELGPRIARFIELHA